MSVRTALRNHLLFFHQLISIQKMLRNQLHNPTRVITDRLSREKKSHFKDEKNHPLTFNINDFQLRGP